MLGKFDLIGFQAATNHDTKTLIKLFRSDIVVACMKLNHILLMFVH